MAAVLGLIIGVVIGVFVKPDIPVVLQPYLPIMVVAAIDALLGAARAYFERSFSDRVFVISFLANVTIMCDGQNVHECTTSEQMLELLQSGKAVFAVSVGSLWHQIETALEDEDYVDLDDKPMTVSMNRPIDELTAMRMRKKLEAQRLQREAA